MYDTFYFESREFIGGKGSTPEKSVMLPQQGLHVAFRRFPAHLFVTPFPAPWQHRLDLTRDAKGVQYSMPSVFRNAVRLALQLSRKADLGGTGRNSQTAVTALVEGPTGFTENGNEARDRSIPLCFSKFSYDWPALVQAAECPILSKGVSESKSKLLYRVKKAPFRSPATLFVPFLHCTAWAAHYGNDFQQHLSFGASACYEHFF